jgi:hypothetical protein
MVNDATASWNTRSRARGSWRFGEQTTRGRAQHHGEEREKMPTSRSARGAAMEEQGAGARTESSTAREMSWSGQRCAVVEEGAGNRAGRHERWAWRAPAAGEGARPWGRRGS